jgi:hypothetical protein
VRDEKFVGSMMVLSLVVGVGVCDAGAKAKKVVKKKTTIVIKVKASYGRRYGIEASTAPAPDVSTRTGITNLRSGTGVAAGIPFKWSAFEDGGRRCVVFANDRPIVNCGNDAVEAMWTEKVLDHDVLVLVTTDPTTTTSVEFKQTTLVPDAKGDNQSVFTGPTLPLVPVMLSPNPGLDMWSVRIKPETGFWMAVVTLKDGTTRKIGISFGLVTEPFRFEPPPTP